MFNFIKKLLGTCSHKWKRGTYCRNHEECGEQMIYCVNCGKEIKNMNFDGTDNGLFWDIWNKAEV